MMEPSEGLVGRVATKLSQPPASAVGRPPGSILAAAAACYGAGPMEEEVTIPTGFDPKAAALFEVLLESALLVATAGGQLGAAHRSAFEHAVLAACGGAIPQRRVTALLAKLEAQLRDRGVDERLGMISRSIGRPEHAEELLRVASLLAHISGGVNSAERDALARLAEACGLAVADLDPILIEAVRSVGEQGG